jgi:hypothetical protein
VGATVSTFFGLGAAIGIQEPITFFLRIDDLAAICQLIQSGADERFGAEHLSPVLKAQVGYDKKAGSLIGCGDLFIIKYSDPEVISQIARDVFRLNFVELRRIAEEAAMARANKISNEYYERLREQPPKAL